MKRQIENKLRSWKMSENKKPLIIKGARQVGKTYSIRKFASEEYNNIVEINFERDLEYVDLFKRTRNPKEILEYLKLSFLGVTFDNNTLLFMDEIQAGSDALTALKFLAEDFPSDIICSGSNLGVALANTTSFPVGYVETWEMFPFSFIEYLWAIGIDDEWLEELNNVLINQKPLSDVLHEKMIGYYKDYIIIGGMPEVIAEYVKSKSYKECLLIQRRIVQDYLNDMLKYANSSDKIKARECYESIPIQLAKDNKKFQYSVVKKGYNARYYDSSLKWLEDSGLIVKVNRVNKIKNPLEAYVELAVFKVYLNDTGLLISMFDDSIFTELLSGDLGIYKGAIYENVIADTIRKAEKKQYYYEPSYGTEIDFIIYYNGKITPIEVKSSINTKSISFNKFVEEYQSEHAFKISQKNFGIDKYNGVISLPIYLFEFLLDN